MVKIIYAIAGEGLGHATRSLVLIGKLSKKHTIKIVCGGKAYEFLSKYPKSQSFLKNIVKIESLRLKFKENEILNIKTVLYNLARTHRHVQSIRKINELVKKFKPDVIITDFESWTARVGKYKKIPVISIDNEHIIRNTEVKNCSHWIKKMLSHVFVRFIVPKADHYFITSFFYPKFKKKYKKNTTFLPLIVRDEIKQLMPKYKQLRPKHKKLRYKKDLVLVYNSPQVNHRLIEILRSIDKKFVVYDINVNKKQGNIEFKTHKNKEFFKDLAECEAIITTAGLSLISEAIYLKKPLYVYPVSHFEQIMNAHYLEEVGYGMSVRHYTRKSLVEFFSDLEKYKNKLKKLDNKAIDKEFDKAVKEINRKIKELSQ